MSKENIFLRWVREGRIEFTEDGKIIAFNEHIIQLPVRVMNKLFLILKENLNETKAQEIMKELGRFQVKQAFQRYIKIMGWEKLPKETIWSFVKQITKSLGFGEYNFRFTENQNVVTVNRTPLAEEFIIEYGKQEKPIDFYVCGVLEFLFSSIKGKPMICEEVKCYAKGDDCCEFVVRPKEEVEKESK